MTRNYLDYLIAMPWSKSTDDNLDVAHAAQILDDEHYGLEEVKERVLEYLAVRRLKPDNKGPILCFVGPPGVGKTSLAHSIAHALGPQIGAHGAGRRARRSRNSRPSPHLYRRDAGPHCAGTARRGHQ